MALATLRPGDTNKDVLTMKSHLHAHLVADGQTKLAGTINLKGENYGTAAEAGIKWEQKHHGLTVDGIVGPKTWAVLEAEVVAPKPPVENKEIHNRASWGAKSPKETPLHTPAWTEVTPTFVHHSVTDAPKTAASAAALRKLEQEHMRLLQTIAFDRGFNDISYSYVIFPSGEVYEGRGKQIVGAHTIGHNNEVGIVFAGNYDTDTFTAAEKSALVWLRTELGVVKGPLHPHCSVYATECPGTHVRAALGLTCDKLEGVNSVVREIGKESPDHEIN